MVTANILYRPKVSAEVGGYYDKEAIKGKILFEDAVDIPGDLRKITGSIELQDGLGQAFATYSFNAYKVDTEIRGYNFYRDCVHDCLEDNVHTTLDMEGCRYVCWDKSFQQIRGKNIVMYDDMPDGSQQLKADFTLISSGAYGYFDEDEMYVFLGKVFESPGTFNFAILEMDVFPDF